MRVTTKIFLGIFLSLFLVFQLTFPVFAQTTAAYSLPQTAPNVPRDLTTLTQGVFFSLLSGATCVLAGVDLLTPSKGCLGVNSQTGIIEKATSNRGLVGVMSNLVASTFNIPVHTQMYTQYLASKFHGINEKSYADTNVGVGYQGISPLVTLWSAFRNLAYLLLVVVFMIIGFTIMLRVKIDPRTVMTIQNQIPKIIIGIILVTFSFAIAALLIDFMYVVTYIIINFVANAGSDPDLLKANPVGTQPYGFSFSMFQVGFFGAAFQVAASVNTIITSILQGNLVGNIIDGLVLFGSLNFAGLAQCAIFQGQTCHPGTQAIAGIVDVIVFLIILISIIVALWKLWISLLKAYLMILFNVLIGPLVILGAAIPGGKIGFGSWFRGLAANLAIFPAVVGVFVLARELSRAFSSGSGNYFIPPLIGTFDNAGLAGIISFATIMLLPALPDQILKLFKAESQLGSAVGQGLAVGLAVPGKGIKAGAHHLFRMPDPLRQTGPGELTRLFLGKDPKGWRWQWAMRTMGYNPKNTDNAIYRFIDPEKSSSKGTIPASPTGGRSDHP